MQTGVGNFFFPVKCNTKKARDNLKMKNTKRLIWWSYGDDVWMRICLCHQWYHSSVHLFLIHRLTSKFNTLVKRNNLCAIFTCFFFLFMVYKICIKNSWIANSCPLSLRFWTEVLGIVYIKGWAAWMNPVSQHMLKYIQYNKLTQGALNTNRQTIPNKLVYFTINTLETA